MTTVWREVPAVGRGAATPPVTPPVTAPVTDPVTDPVTASVTAPVTAPVTGPVTEPVAPAVVVLIRILEASGDLGSADIRRILGLKHRAHVREHYVNPSLGGGWIEMSIPDKPNSRLQKYQLTQAGRARLAALKKRH